MPGLKCPIGPSAFDGPKGGSRTIGIVGAGRSAGVTHMAILAANYLTGIWRRRVALMEWNGHGDFEKIGKVSGAIGSAGADCRAFRVLDVDYYRRSGPEVLAECAGLGYDDIVIDFGECRKEVITDWRRCDRQLVMAALNEWQIEELTGWLAGERGMRQHWICLAVFGSEETRREVEKRFHTTLRRAPFHEDPYRIDRHIMVWLERYKIFY